MAPGLSGEVVLLELDSAAAEFTSTVMSQPVPQQQSATDAARGDVPSTPGADRSLPDFPQHPSRPAPAPHAQIEREIERSERASAALAATRALARAAFTDSQLAAEGAGEDGDIDSSGWVRTEYAALDHSVRAPQDDVPHDGPQRNLVGGSFNPGMAFQSVRAFPGASVARTPIKTRGGAQARFLQESRHAPRPERGSGGTPRAEHSLGSGAGLHDKPMVPPMPATPGASRVTRPSPAGSAPASARAGASSAEPLRLALAVALGAAIVLMGGGVAWKAGWLTHGGPGNASLVTPEVATRAETARVMSAAQQEIALVPPAAGTPSARSDQEVDAALAAAARAAAMPVASVHAAGPAHAARAPATPVPAVKANAASHAAAGKDGVAAAIAGAQARADRFLATGNVTPAPEVKPPQ